MNESYQDLQRFYEWGVNHKGQLIRLSIVGMLFATFIGFFINNAVVYVDVQAPFPLRGPVVYASSYGKPQKIGGGGMEIIPRSTKSLIITQGQYIRTQTKIDLPWFGFAYKKVVLKKDYNADKVPYASTVAATCATYAPSVNQLAYYNCDYPITLASYQNSNNSWAVHSIAHLPYSVTPPRPFMGGVIGISYFTNVDVIPDGDIVRITPDGKTIRYSDPPDINRDDINGAQVYTTPNDPTDDHFVVAMRDGDIFIGTITGSSVKYDRVAAPANYNPDFNQTLCTLSSGFAYCYQGPMAYGDTDNLNYDKVTHSQILKYSLSTSTSSTTKLNDNLLALDHLYVTSSGEIFAKNYYQLFHFAKAGNRYNAESISQNTTDASAGDQLYYVQDGGVMAVDTSDPSTTYQVFYSPNVSPKAVYAVAGKVYLIGTRKGDDSTTYAYLLNQTVDSTPGKRLIDLVPFNDTSITRDIYTSDLIGNRLYVSLLLPRGATSQDYDVQLQQKKEEVLNYLLSNGLHLNDSDIVFSN